MRKVEVVEYDSAWKDLFESEKNKLETVVTTNVVSIFHIGSTSVVGLSAKPVIDILLVVKDLSALDDSAIERLGYKSLGENGISNRKYFSKGGEERTHHIHAFQFDNIMEIQRHLAFRDYLRINDADRNQYGKVKQDLANRYPFNMEQYIAGKDKLVKEIERRALISYWERYH